MWFYIFPLPHTWIIPCVVLRLAFSLILRSLITKYHYIFLENRLIILSYINVPCAIANILVQNSLHIPLIIPLAEFLKN